MPLSSEDLLALLEGNGISAETFSHPPVHTVADAVALRGEIAGLHTKNLFLRDGKKNLFLVTLEETTKVDLKALRGLLGAKGSLSFASEETLFEHLGVKPGAVTLLALVNDGEKKVTVAIEEKLVHADVVNCHPLVNTRTTSLTKDQLQAFLALTGHAPLVVRLEPATSESMRRDHG